MADVEHRGIRLGRFTLAAAAVLAALLGVLVSVVLRGSRQAALETSQGLQRAAAQAVAARVQAALAPAGDTVADLERDLAGGLADEFIARDPKSAWIATVEAALFRELYRRPALAEASWTYGRVIGEDADGFVILDET